MSVKVQLERGVWLTDGDGDPPRTLVEDHAKVFGSVLEAKMALRDARINNPSRPFDGASIEEDFI